MQPKGWCGQILAVRWRPQTGLPLYAVLLSHFKLFVLTRIGVNGNDPKAETLLLPPDS